MEVAQIFPKTRKRSQKNAIKNLCSGVKNNSVAINHVNKDGMVKRSLLQRPEGPWPERRAHHWNGIPNPILCDMEEHRSSIGSGQHGGKVTGGLETFRSAVTLFVPLLCGRSTLSLFSFPNRNGLNVRGKVFFQVFIVILYLCLQPIDSEHS